MSVGQLASLVEEGAKAIDEVLSGKFGTSEEKLEASKLLEEQKAKEKSSPTKKQAPFKTSDGKSPERNPPSPPSSPKMSDNKPGRAHKNAPTSDIDALKNFGTGKPKLHSNPGQGGVHTSHVATNLSTDGQGGDTDNSSPTEYDSDGNKIHTTGADCGMGSPTGSPAGSISGSDIGTLDDVAPVNQNHSAPTMPTPNVAELTPDSAASYLHNQGYMRDGQLVKLAFPMYSRSMEGSQKSVQTHIGSSIHRTYTRGEAKETVKEDTQTSKTEESSSYATLLQHRRRGATTAIPAEPNIYDSLEKPWVTKSLISHVIPGVPDPNMPEEKESLEEQEEQMFHFIKHAPELLIRLQFDIGAIMAKMITIEKGMETMLSMGHDIQSLKEQSNATSRAVGSLSGSITSMNTLLSSMLIITPKDGVDPNQNKATINDTLRPTLGRDSNRGLSEVSNRYKLDPEPEPTLPPSRYATIKPEYAPAPVNPKKSNATKFVPRCDTASKNTIIGVIKTRIIDKALQKNLRDDVINIKTDVEMEQFYSWLWTQIRTVPDKDRKQAMDYPNP